MTKQTRSILSVTAVLLLVFGVFLQHKIDPLRHQFEPESLEDTNNAESHLPIEFALGAALGFREAIAGMLWVRTDEFFHEGNYDAIIPMVRIITWLDPHNTDVYQTGAWHMDYNFTDFGQRSDRRYIPLALALLKEGIANNPDDTTMYADLAFTHYYRKMQDYPHAIEWYEKGQQLRFEPSEKDTWDVTRVGHGLAHAYLAAGEIQKAEDEWRLCYEEHKRLYALLGPTDNPDKSSMIVSEKNLKETIMRDKWRKTMVYPPVDVHWEPKIERIAPMVLAFDGTVHFIGSQNFKLETGAHTWGPADGCRIEIRLEDADYVYPGEKPFTLNSYTPKDVTIMQDSASVNSGKYHKKIDMSTDHVGSNAIYSFAAPRYKLTLWFNPASEMDNPPFVADRIGWRGEGLTDSKYLDTKGDQPGTANSTLPGERMLEKTYYLTRDDIMGTGLKDLSNLGASH